MNLKRGNIDCCSMWLIVYIVVDFAGIDLIEMKQEYIIQLRCKKKSIRVQKTKVTLRKLSVKLTWQVRVVDHLKEL